MLSQADGGVGHQTTRMFPTLPPRLHPPIERPAATVRKADLAAAYWANEIVPVAAPKIVPVAAPKYGDIESQPGLTRASWTTATRPLLPHVKHSIDFKSTRDAHVSETNDPVENDLCSAKECRAARAEGAAMDQLVTAVLSAEPSSLIKSAIKVAHLVGIVLGLGAATVLDIVILRFLMLGKIKGEHANLVEFVSKIVTAGLCILWASGLCYLTHYAIFDPEKLGNQKIWAKIAIVAVLTVNGYFIHHNVLPLVRKQVGWSLFSGLPRRDCSLLVIFGTISATSWYVPLILGAMPQLNVGVPASAVLTAYSLLLLLGIALTQGLVHALWREERPPEEQAVLRDLVQRVAAISSRTPRGPSVQAIT